ncbi:hypothetical protein SDC9_165786 [bioreactor metagenome]|uniref:Uncharacterized protein n=1 Tax=bioreactor metagenome TaxID=1076179 RepID=A0A645FX27_9ZZZZ
MDFNNVSESYIGKAYLGIVFIANFSVAFKLDISVFACCYIVKAYFVA